MTKDDLKVPSVLALMRSRMSDYNKLTRQILEQHLASMLQDTMKMVFTTMCMVMYRQL